MGGRGAKSSSANKLPNRAVAFTVDFGDGKPYTFFENAHGGLMMGRNGAGVTYGNPVNTKQSLKEAYNQAIQSGKAVSLVSKKEAEKANVAYRASRKHNAREIAYAELHPQQGKAGIPARRLLSRKL